MSETQQKLKTLVNEKITALKGRIAESENVDAKFSTYETYDTFFSGLESGAELAGASADDYRSVTLARSHIKSQLDALEVEAELAEALEG